MIFGLAFTTLTLAIVVPMILFFAVCVFRAGKMNATNAVFSLLAVIMSGWLVVNYFSINPAFLSSGLFCIRASIALATLVNALFLLFACTLPREHLSLSPKVLFLFAIVTGVVMGVAYSPYSFLSVQGLSGVPTPVPGPGIILFGIFSIATNIAAVLVLIGKYRRSSDMEHRQYRMIMTGTLLFFGLIVSTIFLPVILLGNTAFVGLFPFYALLFIGFAGYAIIEHQLFHIKIIATETATMVLWIILAARLVVAENDVDRMVDGLVLVLGVLIGIVLIRSVRREVAGRLALAAANQKLEELSDMKSNFVSIASHQLRAPIGGVRGYLLLAREGDFGKMPAKFIDVLDQCGDQLDHLLHVINMFLDITRIEAGKMDLAKREADMGELMTYAVRDNALSAKNKKLELSFVAPKRTILATIDPDRIREVMFNFVENAVKYTPKGSIVASLAVEKGSVVFRVKDSGVGIAPAEVTNLFQKFVRAGGGFKVAHGSGLGLYIAKTITEAHGGEVFVESAGEGKGSTFGFRLPMAAAKKS